MQQIQSILIAKSNPDMTLKALQKGSSVALSLSQIQMDTIYNNC